MGTSLSTLKTQPTYARSEARSGQCTLTKFCKGKSVSGHNGTLSHGVHSKARADPMARLIDMDNCANLDITDAVAKEEDTDDKPLRYRTVSSIIPTSRMLLVDEVCRAHPSSYLDPLLSERSCRTSNL